MSSEMSLIKIINVSLSVPSNSEDMIRSMSQSQNEKIDLFPSFVVKGNVEISLPRQLI